jgi:hypothetical protein
MCLTFASSKESGTQPPYSWSELALNPYVLGLCYTVAQVLQLLEHQEIKEEILR